LDLKVAVSVLVLFLRIKTELTLYSITYGAVYPVETVFGEAILFLHILVLSAGHVSYMVMVFTARLMLVVGLDVSVGSF